MKLGLKIKLAVSLKILLLLLFTSEYNSSLFYPFVSAFLKNCTNPWQYYLDNNLLLDAFPYHSLMLYILYPFAKLSNYFGLNLFFKLPLLLADVSIFYILKKLFPLKEKKIFIFYFINPIVLYAIYIHSQLDIIPMALFMFGVLYLINKKYIVSSIFVGLALSTKFHIIVAVPLILFYLYKSENIKVSIKYFFISISLFLFLDFPFLLSDGFYQMVILSPKQSLLFDSFYKIGELKLFLPVAAILSVYLHFFNQKKVNQDFLYFYFGLLFVTTIFFVFPAPAWYVWSIPFISIFFIVNKDVKKSTLLYIIFSFSYLIFFVFFYNSEYKDIIFCGKEINFKILNKRLVNLSFTVLEMVLISITYVFYKFGIKSNSLYGNFSNFTIGIGGDSGAGKTNLLNNLKSILGNRLLKLEGDGEHKWDRDDKNWDNFTHLNPKANYIYRQADIINALKNNKAVNRSKYDHTSGEFTSPQKVSPKDFIAIAGLHPFYLPKIRKNIDLKIFIETDEKLRRHWKILRDMQTRGYNFEKIVEQIENRMGDAKKYIYPQKEFADIIVKFFPINEFQLGDINEEIFLGLKIIFDANIHIEDILSKLDCKFDWDYNENLKSQYILLKSIPSINFEIIARETIENIEELISNKIEFASGYYGFLQLILLKMISEKLKEESAKI